MFFKHLSPESYTNLFFRREVFPHPDLLTPFLRWFPRPSSQGCAPAPLAFRRGGLIPPLFAVRREGCASVPMETIWRVFQLVCSIAELCFAFLFTSIRRQSFNAFMFEKHFEVLEEGATEERSVITQINCFCCAPSHSCECRCARCKKDEAVRLPCPPGLLDSSSAESP